MQRRRRERQVVGRNGHWGSALPTAAMGMSTAVGRKVDPNHRVALLATAGIDCGFNQSTQRIGETAVRVRDLYHRELHSRHESNCLEIAGDDLQRKRE